MSLATLPSLSSVDVFGRSWEARRVAVVGLGKSGQAAAELLCRVGCRVRITESADTPALRLVESDLLALGAMHVELGGHSREAIEFAELVVVSPGIPESAAPLRWARERGVPIISEIELAFHFCRAPIVAVTGTNGKSSVVTLIARVLQASRRHAVACGNLGLAFSSVLAELTPDSIAVVEVSSFQLMGCARFRPHVAVLLNIGTNHLDRHADASSYLAAKARIFQAQGHDDWAVLNGTQESVRKIGSQTASRCVWFGASGGSPFGFELSSHTSRLLSPGLQAVLQVSRILGIADPLVWQVIREFRGLEHRLEYVSCAKGVRFINDSKSTTPDSLAFALTRTRGNVVVIAGGRDKGMDFSSLAGPLSESRVKAVVLIGECRGRLREVLERVSAPGRTINEAASLEDAVRLAVESSQNCATVLFSPACSSFDMFKNFEERGRSFKTIVQRLAERQVSLGLGI